MIPNDPEERRKIIERMLGSLSDQYRDELSDWEFNFIESITDQFSNKKTLTDRQCEILEKIYDKSND